jgi:uncharacterized Tic20 family protein
MSDAAQVSKEEQNWAMLCHLSALAGFLLPYGNIFGPLIVWLMKRAEMPQVDAHGKEAVNFQITVSIALTICIPLMFILIGIPLLFIIGIGALIMTIMAAVKVSNGNFDYRYPFALRLIK